MTMSLQAVAVAIIVPLAALYAAWTLMGASARRRLGARLASWPLPAAWRQRLGRADASSCGCDGCDAGAAKTPSTPAVIRVHRRR
jgi:hypothetical protein